MTRTPAADDRVILPPGPADASGDRADARPDRAPAPSERFRRALRRAAPALYGYALTRVALLGLLAVRGGPHRAVTRLASDWDATWYARIVRHGYAGHSGLFNAHGMEYSARAFFPLFPALAAPLNRALPVSAGVALLIVAWVSGLVAAWGVYACGAFTGSRRAGVVAAVLWGVLPLAAVESMAYSESLFTALAAWSLYAALRRRWIWAGGLCLLAGLVRPNAMALTGAIGVAALVQLYRWRRAGTAPADWWRPLVGALLSPLGWLGYMLWTAWAERSWTAYFHIQDAWGSSFDGGLSTLRWVAALSSPYDHGRGDSTTNLMIAATVLAYLVLWACTLRQRQPLVLVLFSTLLLAMDLGNSSPYPPLARFLIPAFPLLFPLAERLARIPRRWVLAALLAVLALLSGYHGTDVVFFGGAPA
ncbi:glycosyltransferase family 39 protein [Streptacidiphilus sp. PB12-B1b]|uniref:hypothetical protein n=1 Tax=Streptacidiphilus sp. PB12-B1b TaxID=2705012 RepID=UPI0015FC4A6E|nr:hypothetical protein [Streptacidiphilus sp. PB12-B1b]QMU78956.1 glycosyltransferase family 39 protein [Streptacidiphilus sp. PB12-B1b]